MAASQTEPVLRTASMEAFMLGSQFSESKMRKMSMPCAAASWMNSATTLSGYAV